MTEMDRDKAAEISGRLQRVVNGFQEERPNPKSVQARLILALNAQIGLDLLEALRLGTTLALTDMTSVVAIDLSYRVIAVLEALYGKNVVGLLLIDKSLKLYGPPNTHSVCPDIEDGPGDMADIPRPSSVHHLTKPAPAEPKPGNRRPKSKRAWQGD